MGWISVRLLHYSLSLSSTPELDQVSQSLKSTGHELFRRASRVAEAGCGFRTHSAQAIPGCREDSMAHRHPGVFLERRSGELQSGRQPGRPAGLPGAPRRRRGAVLNVSERHRHAAAFRSIHQRASDCCRRGHARLAARIYVHLLAAGRRHLAADLSRAALLCQAHQPAYPGIDQGTLRSGGRAHGLSRARKAAPPGAKTRSARRSAHSTKWPSS